MTRKTRRTSRAGFRWTILEAITWSPIIILAGVIADVATGSAVGQAESYNQAVHAQLPGMVYVTYRR